MFKNGIKEGESKKYYENGQEEVIGTCIQDKWEGKYVLYHPNGIVWEDGEYRNDMRFGIMKVYDENEHKRVELEYNEDGKLTGRWEVYDKDGKTEESIEFNSDVRNGMSIEYYSNGNKKTETNYEKGLKNGIQRNYSSDGKLENEIEWENGEKKTE
jgi:antitoxin component YwqK of YwqJK toxin-antitoxin module